MIVHLKETTLLVVVVFVLGISTNVWAQYLRPGTRDRTRGTYLGDFKNLQHQVGGHVWALDEEWLHVTNFTYDGRGPDAFFWVGTDGDQPSPEGHLVPSLSTSGTGREMVLPAFHGEDVLFRLPSDLKVSHLRWISIWCRRFTVNFGSLQVPHNVQLPKKRKLSELSRLAHDVRSGNVTLLDAKTLYIPNLHYDGSAPDAYFWVGKGKPDRTGRKIPNEKKSTAVLGHYDGVDIELVLPDNLTMYDIDYLALWCVQYRHNFGYVEIPSPADLYLPPALGQTQVKAASAASGAVPVAGSDKDRYDTTDEVYTTTEPSSYDDGGDSGDDGLTATTTIMLQTHRVHHMHYTDMPIEDQTDSYDDTTSYVPMVDESDSMTTETQSPATTDVVDVVTDLVGSINDEQITTEMNDEVEVTTEMSEDIETVTSISVHYESESTNQSHVEIEKSETEYPGLIGIGAQSEILDDNLYLGSPIAENDYTFRYGKAANIDFIYNFDKSNSANDNNTFMTDFGGPENETLAQNEYTFKYDTDPEIKPISFTDESEITEIFIHNDKKDYTYAVGNNHAIQHVADTVNSGSDYNPYGLVKIDMQRHSGAHFFASTTADGDGHQGNELNSSDTPTYLEGDHQEEEEVTYSVSSSVSSTSDDHDSHDSHQHDEHDDVKLVDIAHHVIHSHHPNEPYSHHPKDVYSVQVKVNYTENSDEDDEHNEEEEHIESDMAEDVHLKTLEEEHLDVVDNHIHEKLKVVPSSAEDRVPGGIYTAILFVVALSLMIVEN